MYPTTVWTATIGVIVGFIASIIALGVIAGVQVLGTGLNSASIKILFGVASILNLLFQINIAGFPLGMGLINNLMGVFDTSSFMSSVGFFVSLILAITILASGVIIVQGGAD